MEDVQLIIDFLRSSITVARDLLILEYKAQGHVDTGDLVGKMEIRINRTVANLSADLLVMDYARYLEERTPPSRIPFSLSRDRGGGSGEGDGDGRSTLRSQGAAGKSKMIQALINFWMRKGLNAKQALGASFATATKWKQEGRPTRASGAFSTNGRRTGAFANAFDPAKLKPIDGESEKLADELVVVYQNFVGDALKVRA